MPNVTGEACKNRFSDEAFILGVSIIAFVRVRRPIQWPNGHCRLPRKLLSRSFIRCLCNEFVHGPKDSHSLAPSLSPSLTPAFILKQMRAVLPPILRLNFWSVLPTNIYARRELRSGMKRSAASRRPCSRPIRQKAVRFDLEASICIEGRRDAAAAKRQTCNAASAWDASGREVWVAMAPN